MIGKIAPQFEIPAIMPDGKTAAVSLKHSIGAGKWLVLFFYPRDFSTVCPTELNDLSDRMAAFEALDADVVAVSTDSLASHLAWQQTPREKDGINGAAYPLASDFTGNVSQAYGVLDVRDYTSQRATFIVDPTGVICYCVMHADLVGRETTELLRVLEALQTGEACGVNWKPGDEQLPQEEV
ncbi:Alkyl hydroperoxide reductase subunit AhpC (peroxiredoxin) [Terribacillus aidingensis]|uniref:Alkyl hydroperoxide reductase subunit AhpC (Peroxiredoxin) n=1 Tax=Terribacillus aidingensis TaxID=586416 RepID=A0A285NIV8_9BACI|nr:peroxiredoxin [Terribacillus aidingensis]SNZ09198.1 Alkyl hydroperoxide reductase subunit AhpC (peroxiredoxin) [Terribacillus aidingensis]